MRQVQHWGVTGWSTEWASLDQGDDQSVTTGVGFGFVRVVEPGVAYSKPPVAGEWPGWVESPGGRQRRFQMMWREDDQPRADTVLSFHERLASRRAELEPGDEELRQLDESILEAVRQVGRLHRAGGTLGFVQPDSMVFCRMRDGSLQVVFPDVGFAWDEERGLREPKWIAEPQFDCLFEEGPRRHNAHCLAAFREAAEIGGLARGKSKGKDKVAATLAAAQARDVRMLARLIAVALAGPDHVRGWCGSGRAFLAVPGRDRAPDTQAPVWDQVITPTLLDKITTAAGLLERLEVATPSEHYLFKPPVPPPAWKMAARRALPGLLGGVALLAMLLVAKPVIDWLFPVREPHRLCDTVYAGDPRFVRLDEIEQARGKAQAGDLEVIAGYWDLLAGADFVPPACLLALRAEAAELIAAEVKSIPGRIRDMPMASGEQAALLERAFDLAVAAEQVSSGSCERVIALLRRQLEARGLVPGRVTPAGAGGGDGSELGGKAAVTPAVRQIDSPPSTSVPNP